MSGLLKDVNRLLLDALEAHGVPARKVQGWIVDSDDRYALRGGSHIHAAEAHGALVVLWVHVAMPDGRLIIESHAPGGADVNDAARAAWEKFSANTLHVLLGSLFGADNDHVHRETWTVGGEEWDAYLGTFAITALPDDNGHDVEPMTLCPDGLLAWLRRQIESCDLSRFDVHWFRMFYASCRNECSESEVLLDNESWKEAEAGLRLLEWPSYEGVYTLRTFCVLRRRVPAIANEGPDYRTIECAVREFARLCRAKAKRDNDYIYAQLLKRGMSSDVAGRVVSFAPLAFAELMLGELPLPEEYELHNQQDEVVGFYKLADEPIYACARLVASELANDPRTNDQFASVALRAATVRVVNDMLLAGETMESLKSVCFSRLVIRLPTPEQVPTKADHPWWKFW